MGLGKINKTLLSFLLFTICLGASSLNAQNIGTVDTRLLLILHPSMENFDYKNGKFFRDTNPNKDMTDVLNKMKKAQDEALVKNAALEEEIKKLEQENCEVVTALNKARYVFTQDDVTKLEKTKSQLESSIISLKSNNAPGKVSIKSSNEQIKDYEKKIAEIDSILKNRSSVKTDEKAIEKCEARMKEIDKRIAECREKQYENLDSSMDVMYLSRKETEERLTNIQKDIKEIIKEVAENEKCFLVIDNSFAVRDPVRTKRKVLNAQMITIPDISSTSLFHSFTNYELTEEQAIKDTGIKDGKLAMNHLLLGSVNNMENKLKTYLQHKDYVPEKVADFTFGSMFLSGGKDLTSQCAKSIFDKYKVSDYIRQRYMPVLQEYLGEKGEVKND